MRNRVNLERFIAFRLIKRRSANKSRLAAPLYRIATLAIIISMVVMIVALSVLNGFQHEITSKVIGFGAHIQLSSYDNNNSLEPQPIKPDKKYLEKIRHINGVIGTTLYALKAGIIKTDDEMEGSVLKGVDGQFNQSFFNRYLSSGRLPNYSTSFKNDSILISKKIADKLNFKVNDPVVVYFIQNPPRVRKFFVSGIYNTGLEDFDNKYIICDVRHIQKLNNWDSTLFAGVEISINDLRQLDEITEKINAQIPTNWGASSIRELFPQLFDWLKLQDINVQVIITLMALVASVNMITALIILILENTRLIGVLKALGMSNGSLRKIFLIQAGAIVGKGILYGNLIGLSLCYIQYYFHWVKLDEASYYISYVPVKINWLFIFLANVGTFLVCILAMIVPSRLLAKISPLKAIRFQ